MFTSFVYGVHVPFLTQPVFAALLSSAYMKMFCTPV